MTVIACTKHTMSSDTFSHTSVLGFYASKIIRVGTTLVGCAGTIEVCNSFVRWRQTGIKPRIGQKHRFEAIVLDPTGIYVYSNSCIPERINMDYFAVGTGRQYALGALANKCTSEQAVHTSCLFDPYSKEPIENYSL